MNPPLPYLSSRAAKTARDLPCVEQANEFVRSFAALRMTEVRVGASMRGGALVDSAVFRHLMIFHQAEAPIDQGLFVFVG
jgi:hypothetical protein